METHSEVISRARMEAEQLWQAIRTRFDAPGEHRDAFVRDMTANAIRKMAGPRRIRGEGSGRGKSARLNLESNSTHPA